MSKSVNQKAKLLHLYQILLRQTDEDHPLTVAQLIEELARWDIKAERKSIYDDLESLRQFGQHPPGGPAPAAGLCLGPD